MTFAEKYLRAPGVIEAAGRRVKRYHISADGQIPQGIADAAYGFLPRLLPAPDGETPPGGWVILHKGAAVPAYLVAYSWTWGNVVECGPRPPEYPNWAAPTRTRRTSRCSTGRGWAASGTGTVRP